ncbi:Hypothetical predicted protein [Paramuricea clavata]|uniref:Uncharacterized protein n=1 Tax=Paramuricea clavata TaxID=317549 RepID=A0A7D9DEN7_PARCT|nr:Hypothetical predicted protein [Paramuricea clavata]
MEDKGTEKEMNKNFGSEVKLQDIFELISGMSKKMDKLDIIQENMENIQTELKEVRKSIEYAHSKIDDLKKENEKKAQVQRETTECINKLEADNITLNSVIDLKMRSMCNNLLFYNMPEESDENTTAMIHKLLEEKLGGISSGPGALSGFNTDSLTTTPWVEIVGGLILRFECSGIRSESAFFRKDTFSLTFGFLLQHQSIEKTQYHGCLYRDYFNATNSISIVIAKTRSKILCV